jgi:hypothetical protein
MFNGRRFFSNGSHKPTTVSTKNSKKKKKKSAVDENAVVYW